MPKPFPSTVDSRIERARTLGIDPYPERCHAKTSISEFLMRANPEEDQPAWVAGRIDTLQRRKDTLYIRLTDTSGELEIQLEPGRLGGECRTAAEFLETGDVIEVLPRVQNGEFTAEEVRLLAPCAGAGDPARFPEPEVLRLRAQVMKGVRKFFDSRGYLEIETPALLSAPDPAPHLASFATEYTGPQGSRRLYLQTSPELHMKRLLGAGHGRIYQITKFFRNGERTALHNPEFTGLEWYEAYADYRSAMETTEALMQAVAAEVLGKTEVRYQGRVIDFASPWERLRVGEAFEKYAGIDLRACPEREALAESAKDAGIYVGGDDSWEDLFFKVSLERVEPNLGRERPTLLYDYSAQLALLAKRKGGDPEIAERFEVFAGGMELANGFTELNDPEEQRARWEREIAARRDDESGEPLPLDETFLAALEAGIPPATGVAVGLDRWVMLLADRTDIGEVRCFALDPE